MMFPAADDSRSVSMSRLLECRASSVSEFTRRILIYLYWQLKFREKIVTVGGGHPDPTQKLVVRSVNFELDYDQ